MVDDDPLILEMYSIKFKKADFKFLGLSGIDNNFIEKVLQFKPDIISMDIIMPDIDGVQAVKLLKSDSRTKDIPVIFLTNKADGAEVEKAKSSGVVGYIVLAYSEPAKVVDIYRKYLDNPSQEFIDMSQEKKQPDGAY